MLIKIIYRKKTLSKTTTKAVGCPMSVLVCFSSGSQQYGLVRVRYKTGLFVCGIISLGRVCLFVALSV
jgi:hypothetical protein